MNDTTVIPLDRPIEGKDGKITSLTVRRPLVKDLIASERQPTATGREAALLSICAGIPFGDVGKMDVADYHRAVVRSGVDFLSGIGPEASPGESSSRSTPGPAGDATSS